MIKCLVDTWLTTHILCSLLNMRGNRACGKCDLFSKHNILFAAALITFSQQVSVFDDWFLGVACYICCRGLMSLALLIIIRLVMQMQLGLLFYYSKSCDINVCC